jgi:cardiolipin synthase
MNTRWSPGNQLRLLENGEEFFPRVFTCIAAAEQEVLLETFILFEDKVGLALHAALLSAAARGARIDITIDGFGSPDLSAHFISSLTRAGVRIHVFEPAPRLWGWRTNLFRRMHRKIVVVDSQRAFVGGINYSADHLLDYGPEAKQDYAVEIEGPLVQKIRQFALNAVASGQSAHGANLHSAGAPAPAAVSPDSLKWTGTMAAMLVTRDNHRHPNDIERHYRIAIRAARRRVVIANAYFFPSYRLLRELSRAAKRGVQVQLILQGEPDMAVVRTAASMLYHHLISSGVQIYEYLDRPLHGKVAVCDSEWATVGSSNLDPLSLSLNLEANVVIRDRQFNRILSDKLDVLLHMSCREIKATDLITSNWWRVLRGFLVFHLLRRFPAWVSYWPARRPRLRPAEGLTVERGESERPARPQAEAR